VEPAYALWVSAICHLHQGNLVEATDRGDGDRARLSDGVYTALATEVISWVATAYGHFENAAALAGIARSVWQHLGTTLAAFGPHALADGQACATRIERGAGHGARCGHPRPIRGGQRAGGGAACPGMAARAGPAMAPGRRTPATAAQPATPLPEVASP
jgi:hypothetical protein